MNRPPNRLVDGPASSPTEQRARELLGTLQTPPRLDDVASARLDARVAGLGAASRPSRLRWLVLGPPVALAVAVFIVVRPGGPQYEGISARGPEHRARVSSSPSRELLIYRLAGAGRPEPLGNTIRRNEELAFAYRTDGRQGHIAIFARDDQGKIYWYHPAWTDEAENPESPALVRQVGVHELPAAIAHPFQGSRVEICALFTAGPTHVRDVERGLRRGELRPDCREVTLSP